jgi:hypothetical protein
MPPAVNRIVALGASNLTRGFHTVVSTARREWGPKVEVVAALGHGRSYGAGSRFLVRTLPGILQSDLWERLSSLPPTTTRALVTDVGNDILYGFSATQTLAWVEEAVDRLQAMTDDIVMTDLPLAAIRRLSSSKFLLFRSILVPQCRLTLAQVVDAAERVDDGLATLAAGRRLRFVRQRSEWYGFDPIHIRPSLWRRAWEEILNAPARETPDRPQLLEGWRLYFMPPQRQSLFGLERVSPQRGVTLERGGRVWLF